MRGPGAQFAAYAAAEAVDAFEDGGGVKGGAPFAVDLGDEEVDGHGAPVMVFCGFNFILDGCAWSVLEEEFVRSK